MIGLVVGLLILWVILAVLGFVVHSLLWLAVVAIILFVITSAFGWLRRKSGR